MKLCRSPISHRTFSLLIYICLDSRLSILGNGFYSISSGIYFDTLVIPDMTCGGPFKRAPLSSFPLPPIPHAESAWTLKHPAYSLLWDTPPPSLPCLDSDTSMPGLSLGWTPSSLSCHQVLYFMLTLGSVYCGYFYEGLRDNWFCC